jgi:nitrite reductase/ring-hydroxylating ferredoxin subunit
MKSKIFLFTALTLLAGPVLADYKTGDSVECNWKNGGRYYPGKVASEEGGKLFIHYNDGDKEHTTAANCRPGGAAASGALVKGSAVECLWKNGRTWFPGVIAEKTGKQVFIHYNDGDKEHTKVDKCRARGGVAPSGAMEKGSAVSCNWKGGGTWYPGVIADKTGDAVFIHFNDGDKEHTKLSMCRPR